MFCCPFVLFFVEDSPGRFASSFSRGAVFCLCSTIFLSVCFSPFPMRLIGVVEYSMELRGKRGGCWRARGGRGGCRR